jgi:hypothetical protein
VRGQGEYCRAWDGSEPVILEPNDEPYVFHSPVFRVASMELDGYAAFIPQSERVIEHGVHHIITVPSGKCHRGCEPPRFDDSAAAVASSRRAVLACMLRRVCTPACVHPLSLYPSAFVRATTVRRTVIVTPTLTA